VRVVVPFDASRPKTRLADTLDPAERSALADAMLHDVLAALGETGVAPEVLSTDPIDVSVPVTVDERPLTVAVNHVLSEASQPVGIVMADLALVTPAALDRLFDTDGDVVLVPGRSGGTNAIVSRHPDFRVDYHGVSIRDHRENASLVGASVAEVDSHRLSTDIDTRDDLAEVLLHGAGRAAEWVEERFSVEVEGGRVGVTRRADHPSDQ
jgi:2-phospho-L-lactate guanylyltransferase